MVDELYSQISTISAFLFDDDETVEVCFSNMDLIHNMDTLSLFGDVVVEVVTCCTNCKP